MAAFSLQVLHDEIANDPMELGYKPRQADGTLADLTLALNGAIADLGSLVDDANGTLVSATSQLNELLVRMSSPLDPADGTLASATDTYNAFADWAWKGDQVIADLINAKNFVIDQTSVPMEEIRAATLYDAYDGLGIDEQEWLVWMTPNSGQFIVTADMKIRLSGRTLAANGAGGTGDDGDSFWAFADNALASVMLALIEIQGSRAAVLWGENTQISIGQVAKAANL